MEIPRSPSVKNFKLAHRLKKITKLAAYYYKKISHEYPDWIQVERITKRLELAVNTSTRKEQPTK
jgi:hypothetical protein